MPSLRGRRRSAAAVEGGRPARPVGEWAGLPSLRTVSAERPGGVLAPADFRAALATTWSAPPALQQLGHRVALDAPAGLIPAQVAPVPAYDGAPLRFAPAVGSAQAAEPVDWTLPRPPAREPMPPEVGPSPPAPASGRRPSLLDRVLHRTPLAAAASAAVPSGSARGGPPSAAAPRRRLKSAEEEPVAPTVVPGGPVVEPTVPPVPVVRPLAGAPQPARERRGPAPRSLSDRPAGPRRFAPSAAEEPGGSAGPARSAPALPSVEDAVGRATPPATPLDAAEERSGPAEGPESGPVPGPLRSGAAAVGDEEPADGGAAAQRDPDLDLDRDAEPPVGERSGPAEGPESGPVPGPLRSDDTDGGASMASYGEDEKLETEDVPATVTPPTGRPADVARVRPADRAPVEERDVVGRRRPLGAELLDAVRGAVAPRPVAAFVPAALPDPVAARPAAGSAGPAPTRPAGFAATGHPSQQRRVASIGEVVAPTPPPPEDAGADVESEPARELPPGVPDWWPATGSWSVRDVDPFRIDAGPAEPVPADDEATALAPTPAVADDVPVLRQRVRPTSDPATGTPVGRRVAWPTDGELPLLRQVRRAGPTTDAASTSRHHGVDHGVDPGVGTAAHLALPDPDLPHLPAPPAGPSPSPEAAAPAPTAAPAAPAGPSADELADRIRHALLVERERSGALADQW